MARHSFCVTPNPTAGDSDAIRHRLAEIVGAHGTDMDRFLAWSQHGTPTLYSEGRHEAMADAVRQLHAEGFSLDAIGSVIGLNEQAVSDLVHRRR